MSKQVKLIQNNNSYLSELLNRYPLNLNILEQCIQKMNDSMVDKIQDGTEKIGNKNLSNSSLNTHKSQYSLQNYRDQRKNLQQKLKGIGKSQEKQSKYNSVLSDRERLQFLQRMKEKQQEVQRMREEQAQIRYFRERQKEQQQKFQKERKMKEEQKRKRKQIQKRLEEIQDERQRREEQIRERNREYKEVMHEKTLFHKIQQNYNRLQNDNLQSKKKQLAQIRQLHKPMSKTDFQQHLKHIDECKQLTFHRKSIQKEDSDLSPTKNMFYKSHWYKEVEGEEKVKEEEIEEQKKQLMRDLKDRQKKYSQYIRHNCMPETDDKLIQQMEKRFPSPIRRKKAKQIRQMGLYNLKTSKQKAVSKDQLELRKKQQQAESAQLLPEKPSNYLQELRKRRSNSLSQPFLAKLNKKQKVAKIKIQNVKTYAQKLQRKAQMRQQLQRVKKNVVDAELDEMYIGALSAKLRLLPQK